MISIGYESLGMKKPQNTGKTIFKSLKKGAKISRLCTLNLHCEWTTF